LTRAYLAAVGFNLVANFFAIQRYGINGAAVVTVLSEIVLLLPFYRLMRASVGDLPWVGLFAKPAAALLAAALPLWLFPLPFWAALPGSLLLYAGALFVLGAFGEDDRVVLAKLLKR
ncbi:MAG: polysaccharide biosynthesis C-terminal domain-containing protein, partial [Ardenticatenaceae bacterium]